jgi:AGZA family xanthine/uracil permease-like MFS transporter
MGGRAAYTLATALFIGFGAVFGYLGFLVDIIPKAATAPILIFVGLEITAQAFTATPARHAPAVALAFVPVVANLVVVELGQFLPSPEAIPAHMLGTYQTLQIMANGFIFTSMVWAGATAYITDRRYQAAALVFAAAALMSCVGIMHSPLPTGEIFLPWLVAPQKAGLVWATTAAYAALSVLVYVMRWLPQENVVTDG